MLGWYILVIFCSTPPLPPVIICHHSSSFGLPPPSPSGDDVICEQPLTSCWDCQQNRNLFSKLCPSEFVHPYLPPIWPFAMECYNRLIPANFGQRQITSCVLTQLKINSFQRFDSTKQIIWELIWVRDSRKRLFPSQRCHLQPSS